MISAPHHLAAQAGRQVLQSGGNAVEAMVAAAAAIAVVYPHMNGIGGDGFWLISEPGKAPVGVRACGPAAALASEDFYAARGLQAIPARGPHAALTVPGAIGGWAEALNVAAPWGKALPLTDLLVDAITHASNGIGITPSQSALSHSKYDELVAVPGFADIYLPGNTAPAVGDILRQPALASTLQRLADVGLEDYYRGEIAETHGRFLAANDSPLRAQDLAAYRAQQVAPLAVDLSLGRIYNMPPPTQGVSSLMILGQFDQLAAASDPKAGDSFAHLHSLIEATKRAFLVRNAHVTDPAHMAQDPTDWLTAEALRAEATHIDPTQALPWPYQPQEGDTIWMGCCDDQGRMVSYIQSVYWEFGSGLTCPETGVIFQNRGSSFTLNGGPNRLLPGKLPFHTLNPAFAEFKDGRRLAYGTMGGEGQPQTQSAVFSRYAYFGQDLQAAITAPRWLLGRTWGEQSTTLKLENRFPQAVITALRNAGHQTEILGPFEDAMGHAGAVLRHPSGLIEGATDPRADGACAGL
jgi:gamma-glutamyltranspeptidase/glutathione hydrolase